MPKKGYIKEAMENLTRPQPIRHQGWDTSAASDDVYEHAQERMMQFEESVRQQELLRKRMGLPERNKVTIPKAGEWDVEGQEEDKKPVYKTYFKYPSLATPKPRPLPETGLALIRKLKAQTMSLYGIECPDPTMSTEPIPRSKSTGPTMESGANYVVPVDSEASEASTLEPSAPIESLLPHPIRPVVSTMTTSLRKIMKAAKSEGQSAKPSVPPALQGVADLPGSPTLSPNRLAQPSNPFLTSIDMEESEDGPVTNGVVDEGVHEVGESAGESRTYPPFFPLEHFDDTTLEAHAPEEWLQVAVVDGVCRARSRWFGVDGNYTWEGCDVFEFSETRQRFRIRWHNNDKEKWVSRLNLAFHGEDPAALEMRRRTAEDNRAIAERVMRYMIRLESMSTHDALQLPPRQLDRVMQRVGIVRYTEESVLRLVDEIRYNYSKAINKMELDAALKCTDPVKEGLPPLTHAIFGDAGKASVSSGTSGGGTIDLPSFPYHVRLLSVKENLPRGNSFMLTTVNEAFHELYRIIESCSMGFYPRIGESCELSVFSDRHTSNVADFMEECNKQVRWNIQEIASTAYQGHMSSLPPADPLLVIHRVVQRSSEVAEITPLQVRYKRLMTCVNLGLQDTVRSCAYTAMGEFVGIFESHTYRDDQELQCEALQPPFDTQMTGATLAADARDRMLSRGMVFAASLVAQGDEIAYSPPLESYRHVVSAQLRSIVDSSLNLQSISFDFLRYLAQPHALRPLLPDDLCLQWAMTRVNRALNHAMEAPQQLLDSFKQYEFILQTDLEEFLQQYRDNAHGMSAIEGTIKKMRNAAEVIDGICTSTVDFGMFTVDCSHIKGSLISKANSLASGLLEIVVAKAREDNLALSMKLEEMEVCVMRVAQTTEELFEHIDYVKACPKLVKPCWKEIQRVQESLTLAEKFQFSLSNDDVDLAWKTFGWPKQVNIRIAERESRIEGEKRKFIGELEDDKDAFLKELERLRGDIVELQQKNDLSSADEYIPLVSSIQEKIEEAIAHRALMNSREQLFGFNQTPYNTLDDIKAMFTPYEKLWTIAADFARDHPLWTFGPFIRLDAPKVVRTLEDWVASVEDLKDVFRALPIPLTVANELELKLRTFMRHLPLISAMRNPGMRERHWDSLSTKIGSPVQPTSETTLSKILESNLEDRLDDILAVSEVASKEYVLEKALEKMKKEWSTIKLQYIEWKETKSAILVHTDDILGLLDDHMVKTQTMMSSSFIGPLLAAAKEWEATLNDISAVLDEWLQMQQGWTYLQPLFESNDIAHQMPLEAKRFAAVDTTWRHVMAKTLENPEVIVCCQQANLLQTFQDGNKFLGLIQKGLNDYLESKRQLFSRFFFLSNEELLGILSKTHDPQSVQPFFSKLFQGIEKLLFQTLDSSVIIVGMVSSLGEEVMFLEPVDPFFGDRLGNAEKWLSDVERAMVASVRDAVLQSSFSYESNTRADWAQKWPAQFLLTVAQLMWTKEAEQAISGGSLRKLNDKVQSQLDDVLNLIRGAPTKLQRLSLEALVVLDTYARDVTSTLLASKLSSVDSFEWKIHLRYYLEDREVTVRLLEETLSYGCEYLGTTGRLVLTPLTNRCFRSMVSAVRSGFVASMEGPAATGKTETTRDLAKAVAKPCVEFNCSRGVDYVTIANFFKGLATSGSWVCLDEFNRIDVAVMSVVAQYLSTLLRAVAQAAPSVFFDGRDLPLNSTFAIFVTMCSSYSGERSVLPSNLRTLFRPISLVAPDVGLIAEVSLDAAGFSNASHFARKMVTAVRLMGELATQEDHYDFGLRTIKSCLNSAGDLRRGKGKDESEEVVAVKALHNTILPQLADIDIPVFESIVHDMFPSAGEAVRNHSLLNALRKMVVSQKFIPSHPFLDKCVQLDATIRARDGVMLVGRAYSGKTSILNSLRTAICAHERSRHKNDENYNHIQVYTVYPKSFSEAGLFGRFDGASREWQDGVVPQQLKEFANDPSPTLKWLLFDGPVDSLWVENMNSVMDDNRKLCLANGDTIHLKLGMSILFEVEHLRDATPATVSRCGVVYADSSLVGWPTLVEAWLLHAHPLLKPAVQYITELIGWVIPTALFVASRFKTLVTRSEALLVSQFLRLLGMFVDKWANPQGNEHFAGDPDSNPLTLVSREGRRRLEAVFFLAVIWSIGVCAETQADQKAFDSFIKAVQAGNYPIRNFDGSLPGMGEDGESSEPETDGAHAGEDDDFLSGNIEQLQGTIYNVLRRRQHGRLASIPIPDDGLVFDYVLRDDGERWVNWMDTVEAPPISRRMSFHQVIIPTTQLVRNSFFASMATKMSNNILFIGDVGCGKTTLLNRFLDLLPVQSESSMVLQLTPLTTTEDVQTMIESKLDKRRKGVFGPPLGKRMNIIIDDIHLAPSDSFNNVPCLELLRQCMSTGMWYNRKDAGLRQLVDLVFAGASLPPRAGHRPLSERCLRQFMVMYMLPYDDDGFRAIYGTLLFHFLKQFPPHIQLLDGNLLEATLDLFRKSSEQLRPTPAKLHYMFNIRHLARVFQGMTQVTPSRVDREDQIIRLWAHETMRVFGDGLVDAYDREKYQAILESLLEQYFEVPWRELAASGTIVHTDFTNQRKDTTDKFYEESLSFDPVVAKLEDILADYNRSAPRKLDLMIFPYFAERVASISRICRQAVGHTLLVGVGGSGRKSAARLAAFASQAELTEIEFGEGYGREEWEEDFRKALKVGGIEGKKSIILLSDTNVRDEVVFTQLAAFVSTGSVGGLFPPEDVERIIEGVRSAAVKAGFAEEREAIMKHFAQRCLEYVHVVLCVSSSSNTLSRFSRTYPALINCSVVNWFTRWPSRALKMVAEKVLDTMDIEHMYKNTISDLAERIHETSVSLAERYFSETKRNVYITPANYLDFLSLYKRLYEKHHGVLTDKVQRYQAGLSALRSNAQMVERMQQELIRLQPVLNSTQEESNNLVRKINKDQRSADISKEMLLAEKEVAEEKAEEMRRVKEELEKELANAMPAVDAALKALQSLTKQDIVEVKSMKTPPAGVKLVMEAVCIMLEVKPKRVDDPRKPGKKLDDYWDSAKKVLSDPRFMNTLMDYDKDNIPPGLMQRIKNYSKNPEFDPRRIERVSKAANGLCKWVRAMELYYEARIIVAPQEAFVAEAEEKLEAMNATLRRKEEEVQEVENSLALLQQQLQDTYQKKEKLAKDIESCSTRVIRAKKLMTSIGGENSAWSAALDKCNKATKTILGDTLLAAGAVAYLSAFTQPYRDSIINVWDTLARSRIVRIADNYSMARTICSDLEIQRWLACGLPDDTSCINNMVMVTSTDRWPLILDPQGQAKRFITSLEAENNLMTVQLTDADFMRSLMNGIQFGTPTLLLDIGETFDSRLDPIITKATYEENGAKKLTIGENTVEWNPSFRLYITTESPNPCFRPEVTTKVLLVNFSASYEALENELLGIIIAKEKSDMDEERSVALLQMQTCQAQLNEIEHTVLQILNSSSGSVLDDEESFETLQRSKIDRMEVDRKLQMARRTEKRLTELRKEYSPIAERASTLFFTVMDLPSLHPMYQFSLDWFQALFQRSAELADASEQVAQRITNLSGHFTHAVYEHVSRSLSEKHRQLFAMLLCTRVMQRQGLISLVDWNFFLQGVPQLTDADMRPFPNPNPRWMDQKCWTRIVSAGKHVPCLKGMHTRIAKASLEDTQRWQRFIQGNNLMNDPLPDRSLARLTRFQRLVLVSVLRPEYVATAMKELIEDHLGSEFLVTKEVDLAKTIRQSDPAVPVLLFCDAATDPTSELYMLAQQQRVAQKIVSLSLGPGQEVLADRAIQNSTQRGGWVVFHNCHLMKEWLLGMERTVLGLAARGVHKDFRLILTAPTSVTWFPVAILQHSTKVVYEQPIGIRASLQATYQSLSQDDLESKHPSAWRKLLYCLAFFHAVLVERRKFGSIAYGIPYEFSSKDFDLARKHIFKYVNEASVNDQGEVAVPIGAVRYLIGDVHYCGRVTDDWDRRTVKSMLSMYVARQSLANFHSFLPEDERFIVKDCSTIEEYVSQIGLLPEEEAIELFGLHANCGKQLATKRMGMVRSWLMSVQARGVETMTAATAYRKQLDTEDEDSGPSGAEARSQPPQDKQQPHSPKMTTADEKDKEDPPEEEDVRGGYGPVSQQVGEILDRLPTQFQENEVATNFPFRPAEPVNTVLRQEIRCYNNLLRKVRTSLHNFQAATRGAILMDPELDGIAQDIRRGVVPPSWAALSFPSQKTLATWITDFLARLKFFNDWLHIGRPVVYWLSAFFFPQAFIASVLQAHARSRKVPIETLSFHTTVLPSYLDVLQDDDHIIDSASGSGSDSEDNEAAMQKQIEKLRLARRRKLEREKAQQGQGVDSGNQSQKPRWKRLLPRIDTAPMDGVLVEGLYLEGASWDKVDNTIVEQEPNSSTQPMPVIHLLPQQTQPSQGPGEKLYRCPVYKTAERQLIDRPCVGAQNFVLSIHLPASRPERHWIRRGTAMLLQVDHDDGLLF
eukprot:Rmarinus@m.28773